MRSPPRLREDATGTQRAGLGSPLRSPAWPSKTIKTPDPGHSPDSAGSQNGTIPARVGRNKNFYPALGTLEEQNQEVKSMNEMKPEETRRPVPLVARGRARLFYLLQTRMVT